MFISIPESFLFYKLAQKYKSIIQGRNKACIFLKNLLLLVYNVVLISIVQQGDSVIHIYIYIYMNLYIHFIFFLILFYQRLLNMVSCAIQQDLVVYPSYIRQFASANPKLPVIPSPTPLSLVSHNSVLYVCASVSVSQICSFMQCFRFHI